MPAAELNMQIKTLGIIAGGGALPDALARACEASGITPIIAAFEGQTDPALTQNRTHLWSRLGAAGSVMDFFRANGAIDLVMIGGMRRPSFSELIPDFTAIKFFAQLGLKALGDDDFLTEIRRLLEREGFRLHGAHRFLPELIAPAGVIGRHKPSQGDQADIDRALAVCRTLGGLDVGQAVIVQEGFVLGVEAAEGTDELIRRCKPLKRKGRGGVLVKLSKPDQDLDLDLPTIGPRTVDLAAETGLAGIVIETGRCLMIDRPAIIAAADRHKIFLMGV